MFLRQKIEQFVSRVNTSDIASRLARGASWSIFGGVVGKGLMLLAFIIIARIISKEQYGELGIIRSTIMMFAIFAGMGIGGTASRYIAIFRNIDAKKTNEIYLLSLYFSIVAGLIFSILLFLLAPVIADKSLHAPHLAVDIRLGAMVLFFITLSSAQTGALTGFERFKSIAINTVISNSIQIVILSIGAYLWGVYGVIVGMGISVLVLWILNQYSLHRCLPKKTYKGLGLNNITKDTMSILWKFSLPSIMSSVFVIPVLWWGKTLVVKNTGFEHVANYDVAEQWSIIILFIPMTLSTIIVPILSNILAEGTNSQYRKTVNFNLFINVLITTGAVIAIILLSSIILKSYGAEFTDKRTFIVLILSTIPNAITVVLGQIIASKGKMWLGFMLNVIWSIWFVSFSIIFVTKMNYGAFGLALAFLCTYVLHAVYSYIYAWSKVINKNISVVEN